MSTAVVVGSGPNGLTAAALLARAGVAVTVLEAADEIGGGARSREAIVPGLLVDHCSAVHPLGAGSPAFRALDLPRRGLRWLRPEIDCVHPLDGGRAAVLRRDVAATAAGLGVDGPRWSALLAGPSTRFDALAEDVLRPLLHVPRHPVALARFGVPALLPASVLARAFATVEARALLAGVAAHGFRPLDRPLTAATGLALLTAGHRHGWPVAAGGSGAITAALVAVVREHGGVIETGVRVTQPPVADVVLYDLAPEAVAAIMGDRLPARVARAYRRFRRGPGAFRVDFAVHEGVPWTAEAARRAGTVHLGGELAEIAVAERAVVAGRMPDRPFVLVAQQYLADPGRSAGDVHPVWTYAHVPHAYAGDATAAIIAQIERFAPGFRDRIAGVEVTTTADLARDNANYVGGDIAVGIKDLRGLVFGPRVTATPYDTGVPGVFLCSAATPPGPGVHGMCGLHAARRALRHLEA